MISEKLTKTRQMHKSESTSLVEWSATCFVRDTEVCPSDGCFVMFFPDGSHATSQKATQQGSSVTMATISSRGINWVKVIATKRKCLVIRISF